VLSRPRAPRTADRDEASVALAVFEYQRQRAEAEAPYGYEAQQVAALVGAAAAGPAVPQVGVRAQLAFPGLGQDPETGRPATPFVGVGLRYRQAYQTARGFGPVGTLLRGVRAGRRAVAANPEDAAAWQALGECYLRLRRGTVERAWADAFPSLGRVRAAQAAFACRQAVRLNPDSMAAHATLADLFRELNFADAALEHTRALARLRRAAGLAPGETAEQFEQRVTFLDEEAGRLEAAVRAAEPALADYRSANPADRAAFALSRGLAERALQLLLDSDVAAFGDEGVMLELGLLLDLGRADEARDWLTKDYRGRFGPERYHLFRAQATAAVGDYRAADDELGRAAASRDPVGADRVIALQVSRMLAEELVSDIHPVSRVFREINQTVRLEQVLQAGADLRAQWDLAVQRAWLRFEAGDPGAAAAVAATLREAGPFPFPMRRPAEDMARMFRGER
jgi:tetratricopeptide (TPR) repeat protein